MPARFWQSIFGFENIVSLFYFLFSSSFFLWLLNKTDVVFIQVYGIVSFNDNHLNRRQFNRYFTYFLNIKLSTDFGAYYKLPTAIISNTMNRPYHLRIHWLFSLPFRNFFFLFSTELKKKKHGPIIKIRQCIIIMKSFPLFQVWMKIVCEKQELIVKLKKNVIVKKSVFVVNKTQTDEFFWRNNVLSEIKKQISVILFGSCCILTRLNRGTKYSRQLPNGCRYVNDLRQAAILICTMVWYRIFCEWIYLYVCGHVILSLCHDNNIIHISTGKFIEWHQYQYINGLQTQISTKTVSAYVCIC